MNIVAMSGDLDLFIKLYKYKNQEYTKYIKNDYACCILDWVASKGHLHIIEWLHNNTDEKCTTWAMDFAAEYGHLNIVKFLHEHRKEGCTPSAMTWAAENGHLNVVKYLHENRNEGCHTYTMNSAIRNGYIDIVKFLYKNRKECCGITTILYIQFPDCYLNTLYYIYHNYFKRKFYNPKLAVLYKDLITEQKVKHINLLNKYLSYDICEVIVNEI